MTRVIDHPADWRGPELAAATDWIHRLSEPEARELLAATDFVRQRRIAMLDMRREDFPLPTLGYRIAEARAALEIRRGIHLLRGLPVDRLDREGVRLMYWGIGLHFGTAVSQSRHGDLVGEVRDAGTDVNAVEGRGYTSRAELELHSDSCDVTALLMIQPAKSGGTSRFVSSLAIHNEIARRRPDLLDALYRPLVWSRQNQEGPGEAPTYEQPVYGLRDGAFACRYNRNHIEAARTYFDAPPLTLLQVAALDTLDALTLDPEFLFEIDLEAGDLVFLNNHVTHHARTTFVDHVDPADRRHLLRLWLSAENTRPLPAGWQTTFQTCEAGAVRGGYRAVDKAITFAAMFPEVVDPTIPPQPDNRGQA